LSAFLIRGVFWTPGWGLGVEVLFVSLVLVPVLSYYDSMIPTD
jgi:hypothetical protein